MYLKISTTYSNTEIINSYIHIIHFINIILIIYKRLHFPLDGKKFILLHKYCKEKFLINNKMIIPQESIKLNIV